ncbi:hydrogenase maturation nickel metallochaperone HypA [Oscillatoria sp. FACHB-1407]|uniref:hydrogenase maturation nickel metallochaperone HypA n=1 Tax=Oscillatoria sp. FACHB-1407 TaxID=2692847 RepID=UPI001682AD71|nr:hydrogenase maturation nickel metallochaperone HypA [Oscillatoria sp. FACHB-1407]MBD2465216.1 hydrogenase maturation nickel metallochaperone HypA [Oscillatoria sp. FACHB-1407]
MHELGITQNIVAIAAEYANGVPVKRVTLEVGKLTAILPDAIRFCFDVCCQGTILEGAELEILEKPGLARCRQCGSEVALELPFGVCHCGCQDLQIIQGEELSIKELETEDVCV